ncbi:MAG: FtsB family cell division protein [Oceanococcaceae bacterium]
MLALAYLQARLWLLPGNLRAVGALQTQVAAVRENNARQSLANQEAEAWVRLLEDDMRSIEYQAREDLGLVGPGETLFLLSP